MHFVSSITRVRASLLVAGALMCAVVAACGGDDDSSSNKAADQSAAKTATPAGSEEVGAGVTDYVDYVGGKAGAADTSKSPIVIGLVNQQGGANDVGPGATDGAKLAVNYVNKYAGGIGGHPLAAAQVLHLDVRGAGQQCGQKMANDKDVKVVGVGAVAVGAQPLIASIDGEKPMVWGVVDRRRSTRRTRTATSCSATDPRPRAVGHVRARRARRPRRPRSSTRGARHHRGRQGDVKGLKKPASRSSASATSPNATDLVGPLRPPARRRPT